MNSTDELSHDQVCPWRNEWTYFTNYNVVENTNISSQCVLIYFYPTCSYDIYNAIGHMEYHIQPALCKFLNDFI